MCVFMLRIKFVEKNYEARDLKSIFVLPNENGLKRKNGSKKQKMDKIFFFLITNCIK